MTEPANTPATPPPAPTAAPAAKPKAAPKPAAPVATVPPPEPPPPNPLPELALPCTGVHHHLRGLHAEATVSPDQVVFAAEEMDRTGFSLDTITGVDWIAENQMEVIYDYFHSLRNLRVAIRTRVPRDNPDLPTISGVFPGANWHEREAHDFFAIRFVGHPNLTPFLLPEDADYHPLRKDFKL